MPAPKKPQDHNAAAKPFTFKAPVTDEHGKTVQKTFTLPLASKGTEHVSGRLLRDAAMGGDAEQMTLGFALLEACGAKKEAIDALYDLPASKMLQHIERWMEHEVAEAGGEASVPQS